MGELRKFRRKQRTAIVAVRLDLDTEGFDYEKWGGTQHCKPGDWLVNNAGDSYTIDAEVFAKTYQEVAPKGPTVTAVRLDLDTGGFAYLRQGRARRCGRGDWVVEAAGDTYTVGPEQFAELGTGIDPRIYEKVAAVWAERAAADGVIPTKEGSTRYEAGDWLVFNDASRKDGYAVSADKFASLYEPADE